ncbi:hypothetical protein [Leucobacter sp. cx-169]|uniref:anti-phage DNA glycosylase Brig1 n=1 Tax=Leucobacter sp. cx-169 TaxID=2770549 RepID=UPI00165E29CC|nr:hypothetical protein [Leucobacter sp. cx-169]MBC9927355.1 hypothetical protein [Leucobacter sp. cx-169]
MSTLREAVEFWDTEIEKWLAGDREGAPELRDWRDSYRGTGAGRVELDVFPEPYLGSLLGETPSLVMLGLNPGAAQPDFQGDRGIFTAEVAKLGYSGWARSAPYVSEGWEAVNGRNKYQRDRLSFARRLHQSDDLDASSLLFMELYPFHSKRVTAPIRPPAGLLQRFVFGPIAELDVEVVFAFGKPWIRTAESLGLGEGRILPVDWSTPSRQALSFFLPGGQRLVVLSQAGYAGPRELKTRRSSVRR